MLNREFKPLKEEKSVIGGEIKRRLSLLDELNQIRAEVLDHKIYPLESSERKNFSFVINTLIYVVEGAALKNNDFLVRLNSDVTEHFVPKGDEDNYVFVHLMGVIKSIPKGIERENIFLAATVEEFIRCFKIVKREGAKLKQNFVKEFAGKLTGLCLDIRTRAAFNYASLLEEPQEITDIIKNASDDGNVSYFGTFKNILLHFWGKPFSPDYKNMYAPTKLREYNRAINEDLLESLQQYLDPMFVLSKDFIDIHHDIPKEKIKYFYQFVLLHGEHIQSLREDKVIDPQKLAQFMIPALLNAGKVDEIKNYMDDKFSKQILTDLWSVSVTEDNFLKLTTAQQIQLISTFIKSKTSDLLLEETERVGRHYLSEQIDLILYLTDQGEAYSWWFDEEYKSEKYGKKILEQIWSSDLREAAFINQHSISAHLLLKAKIEDQINWFKEQMISKMPLATSKINYFSKILQIIYSKMMEKGDADLSSYNHLLKQSPAIVIATLIVNFLKNEDKVPAEHLIRKLINMRFDVVITHIENGKLPYYFARYNKAKLLAEVIESKILPVIGHNSVEFGVEHFPVDCSDLLDVATNHQAWDAVQILINKYSYSPEILGRVYTYAMKHNKSELLEKIESKSYVDVYPSEEGLLPFHYAIKNNLIERAEYLVEKNRFGINEEIKKFPPKNAILLAAEDSHVNASTIEWLLSHADIDLNRRVGDDLPKTFFQIAAERKHPGFKTIMQDNPKSLARLFVEKFQSSEMKETLPITLKEFYRAGGNISQLIKEMTIYVEEMKHPIKNYLRLIDDDLLSEMVSRDDVKSISAFLHILSDTEEPSYKASIMCFVIKFDAENIMECLLNKFPKILPTSTFEIVQLIEAAVGNDSWKVLNKLTEAKLFTDSKDLCNHIMDVAIKNNKIPLVLKILDKDHRILKDLPLTRAMHLMKTFIKIMRDGGPHHGIAKEIAIKLLQHFKSGIAKEDFIVSAILSNDLDLVKEIINDPATPFVKILFEPLQKYLFETPDVKPEIINEFLKAKIIDADFFAENCIKNGMVKARFLHADILQETLVRTMVQQQKWPLLISFCQTLSEHPRLLTLVINFLREEHLQQAFLDHLDSHIIKQEKDLNFQLKTAFDIYPMGLDFKTDPIYLTFRRTIDQEVKNGSVPSKMKKLLLTVKSLSALEAGGKLSKEVVSSLRFLQRSIPSETEIVAAQKLDAMLILFKKELTTEPLIVQQIDSLKRLAVTCEMEANQLIMNAKDKKMETRLIRAKLNEASLLSHDAAKARVTLAEHLNSLEEVKVSLSEIKVTAADKDIVNAKLYAMRAAIDLSIAQNRFGVYLSKDAHGFFKSERAVVPPALIPLMELLDGIDPKNSADKIAKSCIKRICFLLFAQEKNRFLPDMLINEMDIFKETFSIIFPLLTSAHKKDLFEMAKKLFVQRTFYTRDHLSDSSSLRKIHDLLNGKTTADVLKLPINSILDDSYEVTRESKSSSERLVIKNKFTGLEVMGLDCKRSP